MRPFPSSYLEGICWGPCKGSLRPVLTRSGAPCVLASCARAVRPLRPPGGPLTVEAPTRASMSA